ncbi:hypothetical protein U1Q18_031547, partial [Sarracenia purpurea var. burkii]
LIRHPLLDPRPGVSVRVRSYPTACRSWSSPDLVAGPRHLYGHRGEHDCLLLFRDAVRQGFPRPKHFSCPPLLGSGPEFMEFCGTELAHTQVMRSGFERYPFVWTALFDLYSGFCFDFEIARRLFDELSKGNAVSRTTMISGCARPGKMSNALLLFDEMPERDVSSWGVVIAGCIQTGLF